VLFFYAHCPDVCPTILANLKRARETIGAGANDIVVALVTVDPDRDKPAVLRTFLSAFDPAYVGLTGTDAQLRPIYRAYHVQVVKGSANGSDYLVSHTTFVYYIGRDGRFRGYGTWNDPQDILIENLREITGSAR
jgi:protein SCO1/2